MNYLIIEPIDPSSHKWTVATMGRLIILKMHTNWWNGLESHYKGVDKIEIYDLFGPQIKINQVPNASLSLF